MAKTSMIERQKKRQRMVAQYAARRAALKAVAQDESKPMDERFRARLKLAKLPRKAFDGRGNYSMGLAEQIVFPEIQADKVQVVQGMQITIVTTAPTDAEAKALLSHFNMPFTN